MNLMSVSAKYRDLAKKYNNFRAPTVEITVGGTKLISGVKLNVTDVSVDLSCEYEASGCSFSVVGEYKPKNTDFTSDISKIQVGETVKIELGYIRLEHVFTGYINQVEYDFNFGGNGYMIRVEGMDAKGLLMKNQRIEIFKEKTASGVVTKVLGEQPVSSYLLGKEVEGTPAEKNDIRVDMTTDYDLIVEHATKLNFEFFILQGKAYFRSKEKVSSPVIKLSPKHGIFEATLRLSGQELFKTAEVRAVDDATSKELKGEANIIGKFSQGGTAEKMMGSSKKIFNESGVKDAAEAKKKAELKLVKAAESFGSLEVNCVGIPEIGPGRFIELEEMSGILNKKYYITNVSHKMGGEGYRTTIKARVKSL